MEEIQPPLKYRNETWYYYRFHQGNDASQRVVSSWDRRRSYGRPAVIKNQSRHLDGHLPADPWRRRHRNGMDPATAVESLSILPLERQADLSSCQQECAETDATSHIQQRRRSVDYGKALVHFPVISTLDSFRRRVWTDVRQWNRFWSSFWEPGLRVLTSPRGATILLLVHFFLWCLLIGRLLWGDPVNQLL
jgi:hypothetical protein